MTIIVDDREPKNIIEQLDDYEVRRLEIGDYIVKNFLIERKSPFDFIDSILNKRLFYQLSQMVNNNEDYVPMLALVGNVWRGLADRRIAHGSSIVFGVMISVVSNYKISLIQFDSESDFCQFLNQSNKEKKKKTLPPLPKKRAYSLKDRQVTSLTYINGLGTKDARNLIETFGSIKNLANATLDQLVTVENIGKKTAQNILKFFN